MANHIAAIHALKAKLHMNDDDYRVLLMTLTGKDSCKGLSPYLLSRVRRRFEALTMLQRRASAADHFAGTSKMVQPDSFEARRAAASPRERKVWALWNQLVRGGVIKNGSAQALNAWVKRQEGVDALRFCSGAQLDNLIEALKRWQQRGVRDDGGAA